jgi:hypothetical protein
MFSFVPWQMQNKIKAFVKNNSLISKVFVGNYTLEQAINFKYFDCNISFKCHISGGAVKGVGVRPSACWDREFESHRGHRCLSYTVFVVSGGDLCDGPIPRPEESYRLWCVLECNQVNIKTLQHLL